MILSKDSSAAVKSSASLKKQLAKSAGARAREEEDAVVEISLDGSAIIQGEGVSKSFAREDDGQPKSSATSATARVDAAFQADENDDDEENPSRGKAFEQRDLVAMAFAGDNVVEEFNTMKQHQVEADAPQQIDTSLPGWVGFDSLPQTHSHDLL